MTVWISDFIQDNQLWLIGKDQPNVTWGYDHGFSFSKARAVRNNRASSKGGATNWKPEGKPLSVNPAGTDKAGRPR